MNVPPNRVAWSQNVFGSTVPEDVCARHESAYILMLKSAREGALCVASALVSML